MSSTLSEPRESEHEARRPAGSFGELRRAAARILAACDMPGADTPELDAELLLASAAGVRRSIVLAFPERELDAARAARFEALVEQRAQGVPLAYLLGVREFFGLELQVSSRVLVPRPETELLVEAVLAAYPAAGPRVLDLATGSGAIALALKHCRPDFRVTGADLSPEALGVARANAEGLALEVEWVESAWFAELAGRQFEAVVCNPPYVASTDAHFAGPLRFEPRLALDGGPDGLAAFRAVLREAPAHLAPGGRLLMEHGFDQRRAVLELAAAAGLRVVDARADLAGRDRYVVLERN
ncbi:MAG TPA: peptide chain release factor N(5)-glutamine methyltransferase [Gammaproteobacteria bacterium]|nr:peptide chain release factor N(5)-glutamine methyltransferase [Gammaproteobacteria bacterium]